MGTGSTAAWRSVAKGVALAQLAMWLMTGASPADAQVAPDLETARAALAGASSRTWVKERVVVSMGGDRHCMAGESYRFRINKTVEISRCVGHVLRTRTASWTLTPDPPQDMNLSFDGRTYQLSFGGNAHAPKMRWRQPGQLKPNLTTDIELGLSKD